MPRAKPTFVKISGKIGNEVFVNSQKYGYHIRKAPVTGSKKDEAAFKEQHSRTKFLNKLAGELNTIVGDYSDHLKTHDFYRRLQSCFRKEPQDNRFLLLLQLKGMEINPAYPISKLGSSTVAVKGFKNKIAIRLEIRSHPPKGKYNANCYYYEVTLLNWTRSKKAAAHSGQLSDWIWLKGGRPLFEFQFPRPAATTHWLLCLRQRLGINEQEIGAFVADGMQIVDVGTFDKKELRLLIERKADIETTRNAKKLVDDKIRVKAKKVTPNN